MRTRLADLRQLAFDFFGAAPTVFKSNRPPDHTQSVQVAIDSVASQLPVASLVNVPGATHFAHPRATRHLQLDGCTVGYEFQRGKRRTIGFSVGPDGLAVRAPRWVPLHEVDAALRAKGDWIMRKLGEARERQLRLATAQIDWRDGTVFPLFGAPVRLALADCTATGLQPVARSAVEGAGGAPAQALYIALPPHATPAQVRDAVQAWLAGEARRHFAQRLDHFAALLGVRWTRLALSNAGTRWGSARADGSIRLHWRLLHFRPAVIDYVVAHELAHLQAMDHSPRFWDTVRTVVPDYPALRAELKNEVLPPW